jgi:hypothetical protein
VNRVKETLRDNLNIRPAPSEWATGGGLRRCAGTSEDAPPKGLRPPPVGDASDAPDQAASQTCQDWGLRCFVRSCPLQRRAEHAPVPIILGTCTIMGSPAPRTVRAAPASFSGPCNPALTTLFYGDLSHCPGRRDVSRWWSGRQGTRIPPVGCTVVRPSPRMERELPRSVSLTQRRTSASVGRDGFRTGAAGISLGGAERDARSGSAAPSGTSARNATTGRCTPTPPQTS